MIFPVKKPYRIVAKFHRWMWYGIHMGVDIVSKTRGRKQRVYMPKDGYIKQFIGGTCQGIQIRHTDGTESRMCHFSSLKVTLHQNLKEGAYIGMTGKKGLATEVHLHWVYWNIKGIIVDPLKNKFAPKQLHERINEAFRLIFKKNPTVRENTYYLRRIYKDINTYADLIDKMKYWRSRGKTKGLWRK